MNERTAAYKSHIEAFLRDWYARFHTEPQKELFDAMPTRIPLPIPARIFDSYNCECCGEKTGANWIRLSGGRKLCLDCYESYDRFQI